MSNEAATFLHLLKAEPTLLDRAPEHWDGSHITHRTEDEIHPCLRCGNRAQQALVADTKTGPRWLDLCHECRHWLESNLGQR